MEIGQDFKEFIGLLNRYQVQYAFLVGYAVALYGFPFNTSDIDFGTKLDKLNTKAVVNDLAEFGCDALGVAVSDVEIENRIVQMGYPIDRLFASTSADGLTFAETWNQKGIIARERKPVNDISLQRLHLNKTSRNRENNQLDFKNIPKS